MSKSYENEIIENMINILKKSENKTNLKPEPGFNLSKEDLKDLELSENDIVTKKVENPKEYDIPKKERFKSIRLENKTPYKMLPEEKKDLGLNRKLTIDVSEDDYDVIQYVSFESKLPINTVIRNMFNYVINLYRKEFEK